MNIMDEQDKPNEFFRQLMLLFLLSKDKFMKKYKKCCYNTAKNFCLYTLQEIKSSVESGNLENFNNLINIIKCLNKITSKSKLRSYYHDINNSIKDTNLVILSCKYNRKEILNSLFGNTNKILKNLFAVTRELVSPTYEDEERHNAFYYAIRSDNVDLLETLISKWPGDHDYFGSRSEELDKILSKAYEELKLKNILLSDEMQYFVEDKLINLRFFSDYFEDYKPSHDKILKRIDLLLELTDLLKKEYSKSEVDQRFLFIVRFTAQIIHTLKLQIRCTYNKLPWEEMEFCLIAFVSSYIKDQEINLYYRTVLNKERLFYHLENFVSNLANQKREIKCSNINQLIKLPNMRREEIVVDIINGCNIFESLYNDFKEIRDIHSLKNINNCIKLVMAADCSEKEGQLIIIRALQVIGEHLKNTLSTPKLSVTTSEIVMLSIPDETRNILINIRDSLSHSYSFDNEEETAENKTHSFYSAIQNDIKKIESVINDLFYEKKIKVIKTLLSKIIDSESLEETENVIEVLKTISIDTIFMENFNAVNKTGHDNIAEIIAELSEKLSKKTSYEEQLFNEVKDIINEQKSAKCPLAKNLQRNYLEGFLMLKALSSMHFIKDEDDNVIKSKKFAATTALANLTTTIKENRLQDVVKILLKIFKSIMARIMFDNINISEILRLFCKLSLSSTFEANQVKGIEELRDKLRTKYIYNKTPKKKTEVREYDESQIAYKISMLECILNKISYAKQDEKKESSDKSVFEGMDIKKCLKILCTAKSREKLQALQAVTEILVLDIISAIESSGRSLINNNNLLLEDNSPLISGKYLRNHLAHGNALVDILLSDPSIAVLANAKIYSDINIIKNTKTIGKLIEDDPFKLEEKFHRDLTLLTNQKYMFLALEEGHIEEVKTCLQKGSDINARDLKLWTALHYAAKGPNLEVVKFVLGHNSNLATKDENGDTPLHIAATFGGSQIVEYFLKDNNCPIDVVNSYGNTSLHIAAFSGHRDTVRILLKHKANMHKINQNGCSPVHLAAQNNHQDVVKILLENGVNIECETKGGFTSLHVAAETGHLELVNFLLANKANINARNDKGGIPLHTTAFHGHVDVVKTLIARGSNINTQVYDGCTALHYAIEREHEEIVKILIDHGADVNAADKPLNNTPLHYAANFGNSKIVEILLMSRARVNLMTTEGFTPFLMAAMKGHGDVVDLLLRHKALVNSETNNGFSALHLCSLNNHKDVAEIVIRNGADINRPDRKGNTPLHVSLLNGHIEVVKSLISLGANINSENVEGHTPLHYSILNCHEDAMKILIKNGADVNVKNKKGLTLLHLAAKNERATEIVGVFDLNVNDTGIDDITPLHVAAFYGNNSFVEYLIQKGANINFKNKSNSTPMHCAIHNNHKEVAETLIKHGVDVNVIDLLHMSSVCYAIQRKNIEIVELLINNNADVNIENGKPLTMAVSSGNKSIINKLLTNSNVSVNTLNSVFNEAVISGNKSIVEIFLSKGADVNFSFSRGAISVLSPLYISADLGYNDIVEILIVNGAHVNAKCLEDTPLHVAAARGFCNIVEILINNHADVNAKDYKNRIPMVFAISHCNLEVVKILLQHKDMNINYKDDNDFSLLHTAAHGDSLEITKCLMNKGADINAKNILGSKPMHIAAREGHLNILEYFLNNGNNINDCGAAGFTLLHYAAAKGRLEVGKFLINQKVDVNAVDLNDLRPIHHAASFGCRDTTELLVNNGAFIDVPRVYQNDLKESDVLKLLKITEKLLEAVKANKPLEAENCIKGGAFINAKNSDNASPLHLATWKGYEKIVDILLQNKANPNVVGKGGCTPLHYASKFNHLKILKAILSHGAVYNSNNDNNKIPLDYANDEVKKLLILIADSFQNVQNGNTKIISDLEKIKDVETMKAVANACNKENKTILIIAVHYDFPKLEQLKQVFCNDDLINFSLGMSMVLQERYQEALPIFNAILDKRIEIFGSNSPSTLDARMIIAQILYQSGKYHDALNINKDIYMKQKEILGPKNENTLRSRSFIALMYHRLGRDQEALDIFKDVAPIQEEIMGKSHPDTLSTKLQMGLALERLGKYEEALNINYEMFEKAKETFGIDHPFTLCSYNNIAIVLGCQGKYKEALKIYKKVSEKREIVLGLNHSDTLRVKHNIGRTLHSLGKDSESLQIFQEVAAMQKSVLGPYHPDTLDTSINIGNLLFSQGKYIAAYKYFLENLDKMKVTLGPNHPQVQAIEIKLQLIKKLFNPERGPMPNTFENNENDIHFAANKGDKMIVEDLLRNGVDVNYQNNEGSTPLHFAAFNGHREIVCLLLNNHADATKTTIKGNTPLHSATSKGFDNIVKILLQHVKQTCPDNFSNFINGKTYCGGTTVLHVAAKNGFIYILKCLLKYGAIYDIIDKNDKRPIDYSVHEDVVDILKLTDETFESAKTSNIKVINKLKWRTTDDIVSILNARNTNGRTASQIAFLNDHQDLGRSFHKLLQKT